MIKIDISKLPSKTLDDIRINHQEAVNKIIRTQISKFKRISSGWWENMYY